MTNPLPVDPVNNSLSGRQPVGQRGVGDLFGPYFRVQFIPATDEGLQESLDDGFTEQSSLVPGDDSFLLDSRLLPNIVSSLKMVSRAGSPLEFTLTLTPPYEDGIRILNSRILTFGTLVKVQWGYTGWGSDNNILSDIYVFRNNLPQATFGDDISIVVRGHDLTADVGMRNMSRRSWSTTEYKSDLDIVKKLVEKTKIKVDTESINKLGRSHDFVTGNNRNKEQPPPEAILQVCNDWSFIKKLCADHELSCDARGDVLKIYSLFDYPQEERTPSYRFLWRLPPTLAKDIPVYAVKGNLQPYLFLPPQGRGLVNFTYDFDNNTMRTKVKDGTTQDGQKTGGSPPAQQSEAATTLAQAFSDDGTSISEDGVTGGNTLTPRPKQKPEEGEAGSVINIPKGSHNYEKKADQIVREAEALAHPKVGISAPGVVDVWPGLIVELRGTSKLFDGTYTVLNATHTIGTGGYDMELELMKNSVVGQGGEPVKGQVIDDSVDDSTSSGGPVSPLAEPVDDSKNPFPTGK